MLQLNRISLTILPFLLSGCIRETAAWEWDAEEARPPLIAAPTAAIIQNKPYRLPTFSGSEIDYHTTPALPSAPRMDFDAVFSAVISCYPVPSVFNIDVEVQTVAQTANILNSDETAQGKYYARIVAKMPLYSTKDIGRLRQIESKSREQLAKDIGAYFESIARSTQAHRLLGLYTSLESRSQARIKLGVAETVEQVTYLEKSIKAAAQVTQYDTKINSLRIGIASNCREGKREFVSKYLASVHIESLKIPSKNTGIEERDGEYQSALD